MHACMGGQGFACVYAGGRMGITNSSHIFPHPCRHAAGNNVRCGVVGTTSAGGEASSRVVGSGAEAGQCRPASRWLGLAGLAEQHDVEVATAQQAPRA